MKEDRDRFTTCKVCGAGIYYIAGEKGGRPPAFCDDCKGEAEHEYRLQKNRKARERLKMKKAGTAAVAEIVKPNGVQKNKSIDDIIAELRKEGKGPEAFAEYKKKKAQEKVTPIIIKEES